ncbi:hypothetical protein GYMLUDRAFT_588498 [Collybiopsis luxurians FD-317 M1]|uniref:F-box domain-containing protein n=1 Tax=Collybiopsis luxurians FD-317 M1 TaxID=944289 RepID=A0A0D0CET7_9AGAR|nr:hypothetical protein GYMLUDRAFT_588498 [Collybiopsis luxurians FD-317 M1]
MSLRIALPQEIIESVVDLVQDQFSTLLSLSCVSRVFLARCRKYFFASALLSPDTAEFFLEHPHLIPFIQHLLVRGYASYSSRYPQHGGLPRKELVAICTFLRSLPILQTLALSDIQGLSIKSVLAMERVPLANRGPIAARLLRDLLPGVMNREKPLRTFEAILYHIAYCVDARSVELGNSRFERDELHAFPQTFPSLYSVRLRGTKVAESEFSSTLLLPIQKLSVNSHFFSVSTLFDLSTLQSLSLTPAYSSRFGDFYPAGPKTTVEGCRTELRELRVSLSCLESGEVTQFCNDIRFDLFPKLDTLVLTIDARNDTFIGLCILLWDLSALRSRLRTLKWSSSTISAFPFGSHFLPLP